MKVTRVPTLAGPPLPPRVRRILRDVGILLAVFAAGYSLAFVLLSPAPLVTSEHVVPRLIERPVEDARAELEKLNLRVRIDGPRPHPSAPKGTVVWQDPPAGLTLGDGGTVSLEVSDGPAYVTVPDIKGMDVPLATAVLRHAGLRIGRTDSVLSRTEDPNVVVATRPASGSTRLPGEPIDLIITKTP